MTAFQIPHAAPTTRVMSALALCLAITACKSKTSGAEPSAMARASSQPASVPASGRAGGLRAPRDTSGLAFPGAAAPADALATPAGIRYRITKQGSKNPNLAGVRADVTVWTLDGKLAFTSYAGAPTEFTLGYLPPDLRGTLLDLGIGGDAVFWMPEASLEGWRPGQFPSADIVLRLEVLGAYEPPAAKTSVLKSDATPQSAAPDASGPPKDAVRLPNQLSYVTLVRGDGTAAGPNTSVTARVSAWVQNGIAMQRVIEQLEIATTPKNAPGGLGEVLTRALPGSQTRVWVPKSASSAVFPDHPNRELILDIELPKTQGNR